MTADVLCVILRIGFWKILVRVTLRLKPTTSLGKANKKPTSLGSKVRQHIWIYRGKERNNRSTVGWKFVKYLIAHLKIWSKMIFETKVILSKRIETLIFIH